MNKDRFVSKGNTFDILPKEKKKDADITPAERILVDLTMGQPPLNNREKELLEQINDIKSKGLEVEIPFDI